MFLYSKYSFFVFKISKSLFFAITIVIFPQHLAFSQNTIFNFISVNPSFLGYTNYSKIFKCFALFKYYLNTYHSTNNIHYLIRSILILTRISLFITIKKLGFQIHPLPPLKTISLFTHFFF